MKMNFIKGFFYEDLEHLKNHYGMDNTISRMNIARALNVSNITIGTWVNKGLIQKHIIDGNTKYPVYYVKDVYNALKNELDAQAAKQWAKISPKYRDKLTHEGKRTL
jgi:hypothetical protein